MKNKSVLITGGAGFIGSHLTKRLIQLGANVSVVVKYKSLIDNIRLSPIWNRITILEADLRNIDSLQQFENCSYDIVFHLAAYNHVGDSFLHVAESLGSNAIGTANLLEHAPKYGRFTDTGTSEGYGLQDSVPFREEFVPYPISPYAVGKYMGELYANMKRHQTQQPIFCIRPFNTFGPYQSDRAIIPELIIKCLRGEAIETTQGKQTREFNYIDNIVDGFIAAAKVEPLPNEVVNLGSNHEVSIQDLAKKIHLLSNSKSELKIGALPNRPTEIWRMSADNTRATDLLEWKPAISFDEGLKRTIDWFRHYLDVFYSADSPLQQL